MKLVVLLAVRKIAGTILLISGIYVVLVGHSHPSLGADRWNPKRYAVIAVGGGVAGLGIYMLRRQKS